MPRRPPRACPRCGAAHNGRCETCTPQPWQRKPSSWSTGSTRRWRRLRAAHLATEPLCRVCGALGTDVDHIEPLSIDPTRRYDPTNLQTLCATHHDEKTRRESAAARARAR
ncbi:HNH endonuclease signature motif containing protein [Pseudonocardia hispaniensis]|uniref:HNH endonuclease signature motif containing protein n=1 Tax=Pseudonocardia hispaniensis TaxID=904933 RepID=A0ABW1IX28_9PSEU